MYAKTPTKGMLTSKGMSKPMKPTKEHNERLKVEGSAVYRGMYMKERFSNGSGWATKSGPTNDP